MTSNLRIAIEKRKEYIIQKLIQFDIYKKGQKHLYELTLSELEDLYEKWIVQRQPFSTP
ncbi:Fur-regulated basic protein FbpA [Bacillus kexueae]|uniref:Fur-regulated basic protein FbpA n=1 Tax=Aeribacillus kexueae TaxID=2078952 RepID=UPI001FAF4099|nr:Fur-regulated basic protein FbpA [Bacillus kexueae]